MENLKFIEDEISLTFEIYTYENAQSFVRPFDLSKAPLIRVGFIKDEVLLIDMHHIIFDGFTMQIIMRELNKYYNLGRMEELEIQYSDCTIDIKEKKMVCGYFEQQISFYKEMFSNEYEFVNILNKIVIKMKMKMKMKYFVN